MDKKGDARMVDVSEKEITKRTAVAQGFVSINPDVIKKIIDKELPKGDVLSVAKIAGIQAAKRTGEMIPMCHPLGLDHIDLKFEIVENGIKIKATVSVSAKTGVEMEALTAVSVAALTIYDMCKSADKGMMIGEICLLEKSGGRSGHYIRES
ncbi:cyclic pyranopterin monophosphate synthase MoaC [bacterium]|nr:cyclic pyranopterin monophosphate synthase MoaC [bacterium]MBU1025047.1 cyclic pyranopterin monophosphate synthase MoaC [bacterium]